jgi:hypothetical protein
MPDKPAGVSCCGAEQTREAGRPHHMSQRLDECIPMNASRWMRRTFFTLSNGQKGFPLQTEDSSAIDK